MTSCDAPATWTRGPSSCRRIPAYVNDFANVLPADTRAALEGLSERVNAATKADMAIVSMKDVGDRAASDVALSIGRPWEVGANAEIGDRARNAGVIILLVPKESSSTIRGFSLGASAGPTPPPQQRQTERSSRVRDGASPITILIIIVLIVSSRRGGRGGLLSWCHSGAKPRTYFEVSNAAAREAPKVDFSKPRPPAPAGQPHD